MDFLIKNAIWISISFLSLGYLYVYLDSKKRSHFFFSIGWIFLGLFWLTLPLDFLEIKDYFNAFLTLFASLLAWFIAFIELRYWNEFSKELVFIGKAACIATLLYFPYHFISTLGPTLAQKMVAEQTYFILNSLFNLPISLHDNLIIYHGSKPNFIEISYACTGLGSIALFGGAIMASKDKLISKVKTLFVPVFVIYVLNLFRNAFVVFATGKNLFSGLQLLGISDSFYIAHNVIAKTGSLITLFLISYYVLNRLPELEETIIKVLKMPEKIYSKL